MEKLKEFQVVYLKYREWGYNKFGSAQNAVDSLFTGQMSKPHIYSDSYQEASHIFYDDYVYFLDGEIYKKV